MPTILVKLTIEDRGRPQAEILDESGKRCGNLLGIAVLSSPRFKPGVKQVDLSFLYDSWAAPIKRDWIEGEIVEDDRMLESGDNEKT